MGERKIYLRNKQVRFFLQIYDFLLIYKMSIFSLLVLSTATLCSCGVIKTGDIDNCENLPTANAVSYDQSNIDHEMIDAAKINNTALFKCLLQNGANVNAVDSDGISALTYAVAVGRF